jgi:hypothetical protein
VGYHVRSGVGFFGTAVVLIGFLAWGESISFAQTNHATGRSSMVIASAPDTRHVSEEIMREIDDPATGDRWLLERDAQHPGGPGRMNLIAQGKMSPAPIKSSVESVRRELETGATPPLIRAGDHLIVEEHTRLLDAVLEAIALSPARAGESFRVRLSIGGRVMNAVLVSPGHAMFSPDSGDRP